MYIGIRAGRLFALLTVALLGVGSTGAQVLEPSPQLVRRISGKTEKIEITTNTSRILTLGLKIPRVQVNNPELLEVTPLSATEVQIAAKRAGVTQVNLWDETGKVHSIDVFILGDVKELEYALATQFPSSSIRVHRYSNSLVLSGFIDRPDYVTPIVELAQDYSPKVINNISVGGVQQVLLKVKIFEVSRTKLRQLGVDFAVLGGNGDSFATSLSGLIADVGTGAGALQEVIDTNGQTVQFGVVNGADQVLGFLNALQQNQLAKILAEPSISAVSGRPAQFAQGGEIPIIVPQGFGQFSIEFKRFGTQVDFLPIVLGNGNIRLEVRPRISELDDTNGVQIDDIVVPALTVREVDTAVEMKAGQTFVLAGLIQRRVTALNSGLPGLANLPLLGIPFRNVSDTTNEIELMIVVTPEFVDALEPNQAPNCLPGISTMSPTDKELYYGGLVEVNSRCNDCGVNGCIPTHGNEPCCPPTAFGASGCLSGDCVSTGNPWPNQSPAGAAGSGSRPAGSNSNPAGSGSRPAGSGSRPIGNSGAYGPTAGAPWSFVPVAAVPSKAGQTSVAPVAVNSAPNVHTRPATNRPPLVAKRARPLPPVTPATPPRVPSVASRPPAVTPRLAAKPQQPAAKPKQVVKPQVAPNKPKIQGKPYQPPAGLIGPVGYDVE